MCLIFIAINQHPDYPLIVAGNRDEFYQRPTEKLAYWKEDPDVLAGRDVIAGGTWLGVTRSGRLAAVTNYRDPAQVNQKAPSRGLLVRDYLTGRDAPEAFCRRTAERMDRCNGFNLILGDLASLYYYSNRGQKAVVRLADGLHGLSNHLLNTPWPKVERGRHALAPVLGRSGPVNPEDVFAVLGDREHPPDADLPDTGVGLVWERRLSSMFIATEGYGTRSSSLILVDRQYRVVFYERTYAPARGGRYEVSTKTATFQANF